MTAQPPRREHRLLRPAVFFPALLLLVIGSVLLSPRLADDDGGYLTTHSSGDGGAAGFSDVAKRFGWRVRRLEEPFSQRMPSNALYAVLVRGNALTASETHVLLERVRAGASLLILLGGGPLRDSLRMDEGERQGLLVRGRDSVSCPEERFSLRTMQTRVPLLVSDIRYTGPPVGDTVHLAVLSRTRRQAHQPTIIGVKLGAGRIAVVSEGRIFSNEVMRVCTWGAGIAAVRTLDWLGERDGAEPLREIVFDEFHHGYGRHASVMRTLRRFALDTPEGRTTLQIAIAGLVLLLAVGARPIPPVPQRTIARRSPLEHVSALANAYEKVRGTRMGTRLLVKGVRRRANRPVGGRAVTEEAFLDRLASRSPALASDVARVKTAMRQEVPPAEFLGIASIIDRIERSVRS
jgi:hypothetical protein